MKRETYIIDATDKVLGRLATRVAILLQGKNKPDFESYKDTGEFVMIKNVDKVKITGNQIKQKKYYHHSGFPGGLKEVSLKKVFETNPDKVFKRAVLGMLPKNKLRAKRIKRLKFE